MIRWIKNIDPFGKNVILVFLGTSLVNLSNLLYQLLIAHSLNLVDFAAFNSLLSLFILILSPLTTLQTAIVKYTAEFNAQNQVTKLKAVLSSFLKMSLSLAILVCLGFYFISPYMMGRLKIYSVPAANILAVLLAVSCIMPVFMGGLQGLELFNWFVSASIVSAVLKLLFTFLFIALGFSIAGALGAFLISVSVIPIIAFFPLRGYFTLKHTADNVNFKEIFFYIFPIAVSYFCFVALATFDMVLVKYYFTPDASGIYSIAQMVGKIFLFLPGAISIVMFPRTSGLSVQKQDTTVTLRKSLLYTVALCIIASLVYNIFPYFILRILTGKAFGESVFLGRLFSISMSFFTLLYILIAYFLSVKDLRFIKYLVLFTILQFLAIVLFHRSLAQIQIILCINAVLLFGIHLSLALNLFPIKRD